MYISLWENYRGHPDNISFMQFSTKIDGFEQKDSYNSYEQYPLEKFLIFTIYQNYTLALTKKKKKKKKKIHHVPKLSISFNVVMNALKSTSFQAFQIISDFFSQTLSHPRIQCIPWKTKPIFLEYLCSDWNNYFF